MSKSKSKLDRAAKSKPALRNPTDREKAAIDKAADYCRSRTELACPLESGPP